MIYTLREYLEHKRQIQEMASSVDEDMLGHLTHAKDLPHEAPQHGHASHDFIRQFHNLRQGKPSTMTASLKHDGGASVHIVHDKDGRVGVSDKHRIARGVVAYSDDEIDHHFGKHPEYAAALKHLRNHAHEVVSRGHHVQGDILWTRGDSTSKQEGEHTSYAPNRITYKAKSKAPVGIAIHTEVKKGVAQAPSKKAIRSSSNIFAPRVDFNHTDHEYSDHDRDAVEKHLGHAEKLLSKHTTDHLTPEHIQHLTIYHNRVARGGRAPTVAGYAKYLRSRGEEESKKLKTEKGQAKAREKYEALAQHAESNAEHFHRSIQIRHHLEKATDHVLSGINHPDLETSTDGKKSRGEGVVLQRAGRPIAKLVHSDVQHALGNNPRFPNKGAINESIKRVKEKAKPVHAFYGKVRYATGGHAGAINQMKEAAKKDGAETAIGLSNTPGPLGIEGKRKHAESVFKHPVDTGGDHTRDLLSYVKHLHSKGYTHLTIHAGSDRAQSYHDILHKYNGKPTKSGEVLFNFKKIKVQQVGGERDEGELTKDPRKMSHAELIKTSKASRLIDYAKDGSEESRQRFHAYHKPLGMSREEVDQHWNNLKSAVQNMKEDRDPMITFRKHVDVKRLVPTRSGSKGGDAGDGGDGNGGDGE